MSKNIRVIIKPAGELLNRRSPLGILNLTYSSWSTNTWQSFTGTASGFGTFSKGTWSTALGDVSGDNRLH